MRNKDMHFKHCQYIERPGIVLQRFRIPTNNIVNNVVCALYAQSDSRVQSSTYYTIIISSTIIKLCVHSILPAFFLLKTVVFSELV